MRTSSRRVRPIAPLLMAALAGCSTAAPSAVGDGPTPPASLAAPTATAAPRTLPSRMAALEAGTYTLGSFPVPLTLVAPTGWDGFSGPTLAAVTNRLGTDSEAAVGFWIVDRVYEDPCSLRLADPPIGPGAGDLAAALDEMPSFTSEPATTAPIAGLDAHYLEVNGPVGPTCDTYGLWRTADDTCRCLSAGGERNRIWILEVGGVRVLVDAQDIPRSSENAGTSDDVLAELETIIASIDVTPAP